MPQPFQNAVITNGGARLLNEAQAGEASIEFTRIVTGNGVYADSEKEAQALQGMDALKSQKNSYPISNKSVFSEHSVKLDVLITNFDPVGGEALIDEGYYINEIGLYAKPSGGAEDTELLYSIAVTAGEAGDFMPPYNGCHPTEIVQEYYATVSNSAEVTIQRDMGAPALADDLQATDMRVDFLENNATWFGVCGSRKADVEKTVDLEGFRLHEGVKAAVYFTWGNTAENITLNINGTGAYPVKYKNAAVPAGAIQAEWAVEVVYHAGCWCVVGDLAEHRADKMKKELDALKERVAYLELFTGIQADLAAGLLERVNARQTAGKLWVPSYGDMKHISQKSTGADNEKSAVVDVEAGAVYTVVTYIHDGSAGSVFAAVEAEEADTINAYCAMGGAVLGSGRLVFKATPNARFLLVNSCGSRADIEVYKSTNA